MKQSERLVMLVMLWLALWGWGLHISVTHSLHPIEAYAIAITRPEISLRDTSLRAQSVYVMDAMRTSWERGQSAPLPALLYPPLAGWLVLMGEHEISLRLPLMWLAMLAFALMVRVIGRWASRRWLLGVSLTSALVAVLFISSAPYDWRNAMCLASQGRGSLDASLTYLPAEHSASYYARQCGLVRGINLLLPDELAPEVVTGYLERLITAEAIWLIMPAEHPAYDALLMALQNERWRVGLDASHNGIMIQRWMP